MRCTRGEVYAIYVLPEYQRQGIGRQLMSMCAEELLRGSMDTLLVWVLEANPARRFYERLGGELVRTGWMESYGVRGKELSQFHWGSTPWEAAPSSGTVTSAAIVPGVRWGSIGSEGSSISWLPRTTAHPVCWMRN